jgi:Ca2+-binding EF-hand superfamily protein
MKLAAIVMVTSLGLGGAAFADRAAAPDPPPAAPSVAAAPRPPHGQFRERLLEQFDRNHDGILQPNERRRAIHALRRLAARMAMEERRREARDARVASRTTDRPAPIRPDERLARRLHQLDTNHDGTIEADEMPPGLARRLRRFDRNGDGVLTPDELPPGVTGRPAAPPPRGPGGSAGSAGNSER